MHSKRIREREKIDQQMFLVEIRERNSEYKKCKEIKKNYGHYVCLAAHLQ